MVCAWSWGDSWTASQRKMELCTKSMKIQHWPQQRSDIPELNHLWDEAHKQPEPQLPHLRKGTVIVAPSLGSLLPWLEDDTQHLAESLAQSEGPVYALCCHVNPVPAMDRQCWVEVTVIFYQLLSNGKNSYNVGPSMPGWYERVMPSGLHSLCELSHLFGLKCNRLGPLNGFRALLCSSQECFLCSTQETWRERSERVQLLQQWINKAVIWTLFSTQSCRACNSFYSFALPAKGRGPAFLGDSLHTGRKQEDARRFRSEAQGSVWVPALLSLSDMSLCNLSAIIRMRNDIFSVT